MVVGTAGAFFCSPVDGSGERPSRACVKEPSLRPRSATLRNGGKPWSSPSKHGGR